MIDEPKNRTGRPPRLSRRDEWELYRYRKAGASIKTCAGMFRVSVPTANRIIAKFREHDALMGEAWETFKRQMDALRPPEPSAPPRPRPPRTTSPERREARFWRKVTHAHERGRCWLWQGYMKPSGHGLTTYRGKPIHAHRLAWIYKRGEIEAGISVNHRCRNATCCNPEHLYLGTRADNMRDRFHGTPIETDTDNMARTLETVDD